VTFEERLAAYKRDGFTVFENVFSQKLIDAWKAVYPSIVDRQTPLGQTDPTLWLSSTLEFEPKLFLPAVANPELLDFAERVLGPFVQMDNLTYMAFPSISKEEAKGRASGWHRDIWAYKPTHGEYVPPLAANAITYLQDLTDEYGPLRAIPGSHRSSISIGKDDIGKPHADEIIIPVKAGDVVFTHAALYHSGTQAIVQAARANEDRRLMRLFGEDPLLFARANSGFSRDDEEMWDEWIEEDRKALVRETPIGLEKWG
jgi:hypothetical protein